MTGAITFAEIENQVATGERITRGQAEWLWHNASDEQLQSLSQSVRARFHQPDKATYMLMRIINYTNICVAKCDYCSFYRLPKAADGYLRSKDYIYSKIDELANIGGDLFAFNGGFNPELKSIITPISSVRSGSDMEMRSNFMP